MRFLGQSFPPLVPGILRRLSPLGGSGAPPGTGRDTGGGAGGVRDGASRPGDVGGEISMPEAQCDQESFRAALRTFASSVSVVTALDEKGIPRGLTCSAVCSLSMEPPSMLICVNRQNSSLRAIRHSGGFVINLLKAGRSDLSDTFASSSPAKFAAAKWYPSPVSGLPVLVADALAIIDCSLQAEIVIGSHVLIVGTVRRSETSPDADSPLIYLCKTYGSWASLEVPQNV